MPTILFMSHNGAEQSVDAKVGDSVMEAAIQNSVPGIDADCGGACACATCHVYVDNEFLGKLTPPGDMEQSMLEFADNVQGNSRLSCQIVVSQDLTNLRVTTPESQ